MSLLLWRWNFLFKFYVVPLPSLWMHSAKKHASCVVDVVDIVHLSRVCVCVRWPHTNFKIPTSTNETNSVFSIRPATPIKRNGCCAPTRDLCSSQLNIIFMHALKSQVAHKRVRWTCLRRIRLPFAISSHSHTSLIRCDALHLHIRLNHFEIK